MNYIQSLLVCIVLLSCRIVDCRLFGTNTRSGPSGAVYAVYDSNQPAQIGYDEATLNFSSFNTQQWKQRLESRGVSISIDDSNEIKIQ